jgi:hypothetical protein
MTNKQKLAEIDRYIKNEVEENSALEYKAAGSLGRDKHQKQEITKDVSAMANAAGGTVIYGIKEFPKPKNHLPQDFDPIDRTKFSKEWLEQIINQIEPKLGDCVIDPVSLPSGPNDTAYIVRIPAGKTAHQALDYKYYRRYNFEVLPMPDHEVRDVMNRTTKPDASVTFGFRRTTSIGEEYEFVLLPTVKNSGDRIIKNFKLKVIFPKAAADLGRLPINRSDLIVTQNNSDYVIEYYSTNVLFPDDEQSVGEIIPWHYKINRSHRTTLRLREIDNNPLALSWTLHADDMGPKHGDYLISKLHDL